MIRIKRKILYLLPLLLLIAITVIVKSSTGTSSRRQADEAQTTPIVHTVAVSEAGKQQIERVLTLTGSIQAGQEAPVSAKVAGRVRQITVDNGATVSAGQPLIFLEDTDFQNSVLSARATLKKAEAALATARRNYERLQALYESGAVARKDFEDAATALSLAEADQEAATAALATAEESLRSTVITSPIKGVVANRNVNFGQMVSPGLTLMTIMAIDSVYLTVNVEQDQTSRIKVGQTVEVTVDAFPGQIFTGRVAVINPALNPAARTFPVKIEINNPQHLLKPGMFARATLKTGVKEEVMVIDQSALFSREGEFYVFVAADSPAGLQAKRRKVEIGQVLDRVVEIKAGLTPGERVIISNVNKLKDGDLIQIATAQPGTTASAGNTVNTTSN